MATSSENTLKPPYVAYKTFTNSINKLRETTVPDRIDPSLFSGQSGSTIAAMIQTIKYLGLVDEAGKPQPQFREFVMAADEDRGPLLKKLLVEKYSFITQGGFNLETATSKQVEQAFRDQGINGSTITKSVSFFLSAAEAAGIKTSPHVKAPKPPRPTGATKVRRKVAPENSPPPPAMQEQQNNHSPARLLLSKFPDFDPSWSEDLQKKWFASFETLQKLMAGGDKVGGGA